MANRLRSAAETFASRKLPQKRILRPVIRQDASRLKTITVSRFSPMNWLTMYCPNSSRSVKRICSAAERAPLM